MSGIFVSHAASDDAEARELLAWLQNSGRTDVFIDLDPEQGLQAGDPWQSRLLDAISDCEAILCLLSDAWIESKWCWAEYVLAKKLGKRCIPLIVRKLDRTVLPIEILAEHQFIDLIHDDQSWKRLEFGLRAAEIEATGFPLLQDRPPYPGLAPLTELDAALFFGRDAEILASLDELRRISEIPGTHLFAIIGPSGAGKSSFLRAGLLPRLLRDDRNFLPLPALRPGGGILDGPAGLWSSLQEALARPGIPERLDRSTPRSRGAIKSLIEHDQDALHTLVETLLGVAGRQADLTQGLRPTLLLPIDQGEELFNPEYQSESQRFLELIISSLIDRVPIIMILATRTDAYGLVQADPHLMRIRHRPFTLSPLPAHRFPAVIEGPAAQVGLIVEAALTDALAREASGADALPIVAFTLERLYRDFGAEGKLTLEHYRATGGVVGAIEAAFQRALTSAPARALTNDSLQLLKLVRQLFIPYLVRVDETGAFARRSARVAELPFATQPIAKLLIENRLLVLNEDEDEDGHGHGHGSRVEIAHEALIRAWPQLAAWLAEERAFLTWREEIERARSASSEGRRDLLSGRELSIASTWKLARNDDLPRIDRDFIEASEKRAETAAARTQRLRKSITWGAIAAALVLAVLAGLSTWQASEASRAQKTAEAATSIAEQQSRNARAGELAVRARALLENNAGDTSLAGLLAAESLHTMHTLEAQQVAADILALSPRARLERSTMDRWSSQRVSPDGKIQLDWTHNGGPNADGAPASGFLEILDPVSFKPRFTHAFDGHVRPIISHGGQWLAVSGRGRRLEVINLHENKLVQTAHYDTPFTAHFDASGQWLYVADLHGVIEKRAAPDWQISQRLEYPVDLPQPWWLTFSIHPSGNSLVVATSQGLYLVPSDGSPNRRLETGDTPVFSAFHDGTGERILTREDDDAVRIRKADSGELIATLQHEHTLSSAAFSNDGAYVATATEVGDVKVWNAANGELQIDLHHDDYVNAVVFSPDGTSLAVSDDAGIVRLWDTITGELQHQWIENDEVWTLAFSDNGLGLVSGLKDGHLNHYDLTTGAKTRQAQFPGGVHALEVDSVSSAIAIGVEGSDHSESWLDMRAIDRASGAVLWSLSNNGDFTSLDFSPDGKTFATTTAGTHAVNIRDTATGELMFTSTARGYEDSLTFTADGSRLLAKARSTSVVDPRSGRVLATIGEPAGVRHLGIANDRRTVVTYGDDFTFRSWDALTGEEHWRRSVVERPRHILLSGDGSRFAYHSDDGLSMQVKDTRTGADIALIPLRGRLSIVFLSRDGSRAWVIDRQSLRDPVTARQLSNMQLWNLDSAELLTDFRQEERIWYLLFMGVDYALLWSPNASLRMFDVRTGDLRWHQALDQLRFSPNTSELSLPMEHLVLTAAHGSEIIDLMTGEQLSSLPIRIEIQAQTRDRKRLAGVAESALGDHERKVIRLFDMETGNQLRTIDLSPVMADIIDLEISADDQRLVVLLDPSVNSAIVVKVFELDTGAEVGTIKSDSAVRRIELLADPDLLLTHDFSNSIRVWRLSTGEELRRVAHGHSADGISVAGKVNQAATWSGASLRVWDLDTGEQRAHKLTQGLVSRAVLNPDGSRVAYVTKRSRRTIAGSEFDAIVLWSPDSDVPPTMLPVEEAVEQVAFDPTGHRLAARIGNRMVRIWELETLRPLLTVTAMPNSEMREFVFSADGEILFVEEEPDVGYNRGLRAWRIEDGAEIARVDLRGAWLRVPQSNSLLVRQDTQWREYDLDLSNEESVTWPKLNTRIHPLPDGETVAGVNADEIKLVNLHSGQVSEIRRNVDNDAIANKDAGARAATVVDSTADVSVDATKDLSEVVAASEKSGDITTFDINADGDRIVLAKRDKPNKTWFAGDVEVRDLQNESVLGRTASGMTISTLRFVDSDRSIAMLGTPGGLHTVGTGSHLMLWRWQSNELERLSAGNPINSLTASPDRTLLATAEGAWQHGNKSGVRLESPIIVGKPGVRIWETDSGIVLHTLPNEYPVSDVQFSPDGALLVARSSRDFTVYETSGWTKVRSFSLELGVVGGKTAFAGNDWIVAPAKNGVYLYAVRSGQTQFLRHGEDFPSFSVSSDGRTIATASRHDLAIWDVASGQSRFRKTFDQGFGYALVGPDARLYVTEDYQKADGLITNIPWRTADLVDALCQRAGRDITADEIELYFSVNSGDQTACTADQT